MTERYLNGQVSGLDVVQWDTQFIQVRVEEPCILLEFVSHLPQLVHHPISMQLVEDQMFATINLNPHLSLLVVVDHKDREPLQLIKCVQVHMVDL